MLGSIRSRVMPALLTTMSRPPNLLCVAASIASAVSRSATLPGTNSASAPRSRIRARVSSTASFSTRSLTTTDAPARASASASARPRPAPAPVTTATRPSRDTRSSFSTPPLASALIHVLLEIRADCRPYAGTLPTRTRGHRKCRTCYFSWQGSGPVTVRRSRLGERRTRALGDGLADGVLATLGYGMRDDQLVVVVEIEHVGRQPDTHAVRFTAVEVDLDIHSGDLASHSRRPIASRLERVPILCNDSR